MITITKPEIINTLSFALCERWDIIADSLDGTDLNDMRDAQQIIDACKALNQTDSVLMMQDTLIEALITRLEAIKQENLDI